MDRNMSATHRFILAKQGGRDGFGTGINSCRGCQLQRNSEAFSRERFEGEMQGMDCSNHSETPCRQISPEKGSAQGVNGKTEACQD